MDEEEEDEDLGKLRRILSGLVESTHMAARK